MYCRYCIVAWRWGLQILSSMIRWNNVGADRSQLIQQSVAAAFRWHGIVIFISNDFSGPILFFILYAAYKSSKGRLAITIWNRFGKGYSRFLNYQPYIWQQWRPLCKRNSHSWNFRPFRLYLNNYNIVVYVFSFSL